MSGRLAAGLLAQQFLQFRPQLIVDRLLGLDDVADVVFGHVQFQQPRAVGIGHPHQLLAPLHRPEEQAVPQVPGEHLAGDGAADVQLQLLRLVERQLRVQGAQRLVQLRFLALQLEPVLDAQPLRSAPVRSCPAVPWRPICFPRMSCTATPRSVLRSLASS